MVTLLGPADVRRLAAELDLRPTKRLGQNFVVDQNTVRRIVAAAQLRPNDVVLEVGPGLGSLTVALLPEVHLVHAVEIDAGLAERLPATARERAGELAGRLRVHHRDALMLAATDLDPTPTALVANLPYNVAVPVVLHLLAELSGLRRGLVMVQREVADRLTAAPGSKVYGAPSAKLAWYAQARPAGRVPPSVFWPEPHVESGLVAFECRTLPLRAGAGVQRSDVFRVIDAAFGQRRKMLRSALADWAGGANEAASILRRAGISATARGEQLDVTSFAAIAAVGVASPGR